MATPGADLEPEVARYLVPASRMLRHDLTPADPVPEAATAVFVNVATGAADAWVIDDFDVNPLAAEFYTTHTIGEAGRFFLLEARERALAPPPNGEPLQLLVDRATSETFEVALDVAVAVVPNARGYGVFEFPEAGFWLLRFEGSTAKVVGRAPPSMPPSQVLFSPDGRFAYFAPGVLSRIDLGTGTSLELGAHADQLFATNEGFVARRAGDTAATYARHDWDGALLGASTVPLELDGRLAPDGRTLYRLDTFAGLHGPSGIGGTTYWPVLTLTDLATGEASLRVHGVSLCLGRAYDPTPGWLADGAQLVVSTFHGYEILDPAARTGMLLPFDVDRTGAAPSPADPTLFLVAGQVLDAGGAPALDARGATSWASDGRTVFRTREWTGPGDGYGGDCGAGTGGLRPYFEEPPFADTIELHSPVGGLLFAYPDAGSDVLDTLGPNDVLTVTDAVSDGPSFTWCNGARLCSITRDRGAPTDWWFHVQLTSDLAGWVRATEVDWARASD